MAFGDTWLLPCGHVGIELSRSPAGNYLTISRIRPEWPWPEPPREYVADLCKPADGEAVPDEVVRMLREVAV